MNNIKPYNKNESKKEQIRRMFNNIASNYDILNSLLSFGIDNFWRKKAVSYIGKPKKVLDIATGTADFAIITAKYTSAQITGIDISEKMLEIGKKKIKKKNLENRINLKLADCENLPFADKIFDSATVGFGVRNFENQNKGLKEIYRTLKKGGTLTILEPNTPKKFPFKNIYNLYFNKILPLIGGLISKDKEAYSYLPNSVKEFPAKEIFIKDLKNIGFTKSKHISLSFGIISLYIAIK
mgnify:CR=1 FL=1|tara:strand:- start:11073 stop:11789 length:717 start_codon:yes stop_codon:yes gene_type:complete